MCYDIEECNIHNLQETEHAYQTQNHQTTKPSHPQDIKKNRHTPPQFNTTLNPQFTPLSTEYGLKNKKSPVQKCSAEEASTGWFLSWLP